MNYKVHFVDNDTFETLPGRQMGTKLGVAYPEYGEAYIRKTGSNLVDIFTLAHEMEHLEGNDLDEHYDPEFKAYYKDFGQTLQSVGAPLASFIPGIGPMASMAANMGGSLLHGMGQQKAEKSALSQLQGSMGGMNSFQQPGMGAPSDSPNVIQAPGGDFGQSGGSGGAGGIADLRRQLYGNGSFAGMQ